MIAKGVPHRDGAVLARYLVTGKERERAELWELRGFPCTGIMPAFRSVHVMSAATKCHAPFFHVSVRNAQADNLDRSQWEFVANSLERTLGLTDQPRAIAFHTAEDTGLAHMHVVWSRINSETLTAKPLPFFKQRLKQACRELEDRFQLTPVPNERRSSISFAPTRAEEEQARRLSVDVHAVRESIKTCFQRSDCGRSFRDSLSQEGLVLARGDRRDFLIVDRAGGIHALGKRIVGISAAQIRDRLADLPADAMPTLDQARAILAERSPLSPGITITASPDHKIAASEKVAHTNSSPRSQSSRKGRAAGKTHAADNITTELAVVRVVVPIDEFQPPVPTSSQSLEMPNTSVYQSYAEIPPTIATLEIRGCGLTVPDDHAADDPVTQMVFQTEATPPAPKIIGIVTRLREQFRALVKQLTVRNQAQSSSSRRRRRDSLGGAFKVAGAWLLRRMAQIPPLHFVDPNWEAFTWLRLWEHHDPPGIEDHREHCQSTTANHSPQL